jgi:flagellar protein FliO/FliZ
MDSSLLEIGFKMSVALGVVLLTFGGAVLVAKKFFGKGLSSFGRKESALSRSKLQIEASRAIGQGRNLHIIRFGEKLLLVGATNNNITLISEMDAELSDEDNSFQTLLDNNQEERREKSIKDEIGSRLREIARV